MTERMLWLLTLMYGHIISRQAYLIVEACADDHPTTPASITYSAAPTRCEESSHHVVSGHRAILLIGLLSAQGDEQDYKEG